MPVLRVFGEELRAEADQATGGTIHSWRTQPLSPWLTSFIRPRRFGQQLGDRAGELPSGTSTVSRSKGSWRTPSISL
ncbi:hypothetical protein [Candidatus Neomicrothrix sp.]|uniref:hypothetical protein n=1 Tax=Candidatus Neomicrothrix sp. TaxID=2719034 RepID=UPI0025BD918B|nr:hypothetical protein [Candidatus Microthrix sp.]